jgi:site-specific recombinase XerD
MAARRQLPVGALLCVLRGATAGRHWESSSARKQLARTAAKAGVRRRFAPHQLRHAHAVEMAHEGVPLVVIQLQHEQVETTQMYIHADLAIKERALARTKPLDSKPGRYRPPDALLGFLDGL